MGDPGTTLALGALALSGLFGGRLMFAGRRPPELDVEVDDEHLVVRMRGWDALWAQRARVRVPLQHVTGVAVEPVGDLPWRGIPLLGTMLPGVMRVGTLLVHGERELWNARPGSHVLRVELTGAGRYHRLFLQVPEPGAAAARLRRVVRPWVPALL